MRSILHQRSSKVADYFFVVGAAENELELSSNGNNGNSGTPPSDTPLHEWVFIDKVIDRYPSSSSSTLKASRAVPFPEGVHLFCLPAGLRLSSVPLSPTFHSFVHTSENASRLLGSCLTFYEPINSMQLLSLRNLVEYALSKEQLADIVEKQWWVPKCICLISQWPFVYSFKRVLCQIYLMSFGENSLPLERYISNFINDVPAPPVGRVDITYYLSSSTITFRCPPMNQPHAWSGLPLTPLFECLSLPNILALFSAVVAERQIIYVSSQYSVLTYCIEAITSLIYPLKWSHVYIPILPLSLIGTRLFKDYKCSFG